MLFKVNWFVIESYLHGKWNQEADIAALKVSVFVVFMVLFSRIRIEYGDLQSKFPNSLQMWENANQKRCKIRHFYAVQSIEKSLIPRLIIMTDSVLICFRPLELSKLLLHDSVKSVHIWSYSGPYFPAFGLNVERYFVSLRIQSECGNMRTRLTPNTDTF